MAVKCDFKTVNTVLTKGNLKALHEVLGIHQFQAPLHPPPPSLRVKLKSLADTTRLTFNLANNVKATDPEDAAEKLMIREYPDIQNPKSATIIPEFFIPSDPVLIDKPDVDHEIELQRIHKDEKAKGKGKKGKGAETSVHKDLANLHGKTSGDPAERKVFSQLQRILKADGQDLSDAILLHALHVGNFVKQLDINEAETDFVLLLPRRKLIVFIEVKNRLTDNQHCSASKQLQRNIKMFEELFYDILDEGWQFCACTFFLDNCKATVCSDCDKWSLSGDEDFQDLLSQIKSHCPIVKVDEQQEKKIRQKILKIVSLFLFTIHIRLPTTPSRSVEEIVELMGKIGDPQNILFWSKEQFELVTTEKHDLVLLKAGYGAGKSIVMQTRCENVANKGFKCLYVLGGAKNKKPMLLHIKMSHTWMKNPNILVRSYNEIQVSEGTIIP